MHINIANNIRLVRFITVSVVVIETLGDQACYCKDAKPLYHDDPYNIVPVVFSSSDDRIARFNSMIDAINFCRSRGIKRGHGKPVLHTYQDIKMTTPPEPAPSTGVSFRSTPEMWRRRGMPNITIQRIIAGVKPMQHKLRMERQAKAGSLRRKGIFNIPA